jgi:hypothetical protein
MPALKNLFHRLTPILIGLVLLGSALLLAVSATMLNTGPWSGGEGSVLASSNALANTYLPFMQRSMCTEVPEVVTTWTVTDSPIRVSCHAIIPSGVTLTIEAGVSVLFEDYASLEIYGTLQAVGSEYAPIYFQPLKNNTPGSWGHVAFMPGSSGVLDHALLEYGGDYGGLVYIASDQVQVLNSVVQYSTDMGIIIEAASPLISGTQILSNTGSVYGGGLYNDTGSPTIQNNTFIGNLAAYGGGLYNSTGSPIIQNNIFSGNSVSSYGGGLYNEIGNPIIQDNTFISNTINGPGGGLFNAFGSSIIQNNTFVGNSANEGGGLYTQFGNPVIQNNIFNHNTAASGGGLYTGLGDPVIQNNIFYSNLAIGGGGDPLIGGGGGIYNLFGSPFIRSNILVSNTASSAGGGIYDYFDGESPTLGYNDVWNNTGGDYSGVTPGAHDISADPLLVDPTNGDFHLSSGSPCIDAGDPVNYPATDFEGDPRPMGLAPDIGADEFRSLLTFSWRPVAMIPEIWMYWAAKR